MDEKDRFYSFKEVQSAESKLKTELNRVNRRRVRPNYQTIAEILEDVCFEKKELTYINALEMFTEIIKAKGKDPVKKDNENRTGRLLRTIERKLETKEFLQVMQPYLNKRQGNGNKQRTPYSNAHKRVTFIH